MLGDSEIEKHFSEDIDYLNDVNRVAKLKREKDRIGISPERRNFLNKTLNSKVNPKSWNNEYREHMLYRIVYALISPYPPRKEVLAKKLGIHPVTLQKLIRTEQYDTIKNDLRRDLRKKWGANIDMVVVKNALRGSKYHAELFYKLQGELIEKMEVTKKEDIPETTEGRKEMIEKYIEELGMSTRVKE